MPRRVVHPNSVGRDCSDAPIATIRDGKILTWSRVWQPLDWHKPWNRSLWDAFSSRPYVGTGRNFKRPQWEDVHDSIHPGYLFAVAILMHDQDGDPWNFPPRLQAYNRAENIKHIVSGLLGVLDMPATIQLAISGGPSRNVIELGVPEWQDAMDAMMQKTDINLGMLWGMQQAQLEYLSDWRCVAKCKKHACESG